MTAPQALRLPTCRRSRRFRIAFVPRPSQQCGALEAGSATVDGTAAVPVTHTATGALAAGSADVSGGARHGSEAQLQPAGRRRHRYDWLNPPTRERLAELAREQREAMGILPRPAQKRVAAQAKKAARKPGADISALAPVAVQVAQEEQAPARDVIAALEAAFRHQHALVESAYLADMARHQEEAQEQARQAALTAQALAARLDVLRAEDDALLQADEAARAEAIAMIRRTQQALLALLQGT